ncbi:MAG: hypothetical protein ACE5G2_01435 [Candidatus Krumholzibacteriia bacterium]
MAICAVREHSRREIDAHDLALELLLHAEVAADRLQGARRG